MRFLAETEFAAIQVERTFRPGRVGPTAMALIVWGSLVVPVAARESLHDFAASVPWYAWVLASPVIAIAALLVLLILHSVAEFAVRAWRPEAWIAKTAWDGVYLNLRSWQNAHFELDGPTVVFLPWSAIAATRVVVERFDTGTAKRAPPSRRWVALDLLEADTSELERRLGDEASRPGPEGRFLGLRMRGRYHHTPVIVPERGVVQVEWLGGEFLRQLARQVTTTPAAAHVRIASAERSIEERIAELVQRGDPLTAIELARREGNLSLLEAKELVERVGQKAA